GSARPNTCLASAGAAISWMATDNPRRAAAACKRRVPPTAKNGGKPDCRDSQLSTISSGPMPAGSPKVRASGGRGGSSVIVDHRVAPQIPQVALGAAVDAVILQLVQQLIAAGASLRRRFLPAAEHEHADSF